MTSARTRRWLELGAGPVASLSFPRTTGDAREVLGTWGLMGGVGGRRGWQGIGWKEISQPWLAQSEQWSAAPSPETYKDPHSGPGSGYPGWILRHCWAVSETAAALSFLSDLRGGLPRRARAGWRIPGGVKGGGVSFKCSFPSLTTTKKFTFLWRELGRRWSVWTRPSPSSLSAFSSQTPLFSGSKLEREVKGLGKLCLDVPHPSACGKLRVGALGG